MSFSFMEIPAFHPDLRKTRTSILQGTCACVNRSEVAGLGVAVDAAVLALFGVGETEDVRDFLLGRRDAARVFAAQDVRERFGQLNVLFLDTHTVTDDVDRDVRAHIAQHVQVKVDRGVDLDDVLFAHLGGVGVFDDGNLAVEIAQVQHVVDAHGLAGRDVVDDNTVLDGINVHTLTSSSLRMSAMRMYLP